LTSSRPPGPSWTATSDLRSPTRTSCWIEPHGLVRGGIGRRRSLPDLDDIYGTRAEDYDRLVAREDHEGNILRTIQGLVPLAGADVVEFGAGTGRLTALLAPRVRSIRAYDSSAHMLERARANLGRLGLENWRLEVADYRAVPAPSHGADLAIAGWAISHVVAGGEGDWRPEVDAALSEMERVLRPGGTAIVLETLGTGHAEPHPPQGLFGYYEHLEAHGFAREEIRTDYRFASIAEAEQLTRFFFGDELADRVMGERSKIVPECTGVWWHTP
jgi:ubiquinone/menaquinone biosynthesis C-methylase UbiE